MIRTAVIPIAGRGTRMGPLAAAVPKALFPLVDAQGLVQPVLGVIMDEAFQAGLERLIVVVSPGTDDLLRSYLDAVSLTDRVSLVTQPQPRGLGQAVLQAADAVGQQPFAVLLGDHVRRPGDIRPVLIEHASRGGLATVGMHLTPVGQAGGMGVATGEALSDFVYRCTRLVEKPDPQIARSMACDAPGGPSVLAHAGVYAFEPILFDVLDRLASQTPPGTEVELTAAQQQLLTEHPDEYYLVQLASELFDTGCPKGYARALRAWQEETGP